MYIIWDRDYFTPEDAQFLYATDDLMQAKKEFKILDLDHPYDGGDIQLCIGVVDNKLFVDLVRQHALDDGTVFDTLELLQKQGKYKELYYNDGTDGNQDINF